MKKYPVKARSCFDFICWAGVVGAVTFATNAVAQIVPDNTLGTERSTVTPAMVRGLPSDRIDGGAVRGSNLFHSFQQFNIGEGRGAYFANPAGIENILSRVTGNSRSEILGRLGVLGNANLFLLNPNGIVFGSNASLDVAGSFTASTANAIALGDQGFFSATQPDKSSLLAIAPGALFFDQQLRQPKTIQNSGNLTAGRNLTLAADNLELQGQVRSGGNLTLQAQDTLRIRDSVTAPFIVSAGGNLLVQGDQSVDIFALNHPDSGLFSGGDMVLRSANTVGGDAHYTAGGTFRIEQLNGTPGNLFSPYDPIVYAFGDVVLDSYTGASLHILAGGNVTVLGNITIDGKDTSNNAIIDRSFRLSDGNIVKSFNGPGIDGTFEPTLDIRAGIDWTKLGGFPLASFPAQIFDVVGGSLTLFPPTVSFSPSGSSIRVVGTIRVGTSNQPGLTLLTNQYFPNTSNGSITVDKAILVYSNVYIDSRSGLTTGYVDTSAPSGTAGEIRLIANGTVDTTRGDLRSFVGTVNNNGNITYANGTGGNVTIISRNGRIDTKGISSSVLGAQAAGDPNGQAGEISLLSFGDIRTNSNIGSFVQGGRGNGGNITLHSLLGAIDTRAGYVNSTTSNGSSGNITFEAFGNITTGTDAGTGRSIPAIGSYIGAQGTGSAGRISLTSYAGQIDTRLGTLSSTTPKDGVSNAITLTALGNIFVGNVESFSSGTDNGGNIRIKSKDGSVFLSNAHINATNYGSGLAGDINIDARNQVLIQNQSEVSGNGNFGRIFIRVSDGSFVLDNSKLRTDDASNDASNKAIFAGDISISAREVIRIQNESQISSVGNFGRIALGQSNFDKLSFSPNEIFIDDITSSIANPTLTTTNSRAGKAGDISLSALNRVSVTNSTITSNTRGTNVNAGSITFKADSVLLSKSFATSVVERGAVGDGGSITVSATRLSVKRSQLQTQTSGTGDAGRVFLQVDGGAVSLNSSIIFSSVQPGAVGHAGSISISAASIFLEDQTQLQTQTGGIGDAGRVFLQANGGTVSLDNRSVVFSSVLSGAVGTAGGIDVQVGSFSVTNSSRLTTSTSGQGNAGFISVQASGNVSLNGEGSGIFSSVGANSTNTGGRVRILAKNISVTNNAAISVSNGGLAGAAGNVGITTGAIVLDRGGTITGTTQSGRGGNIELNADKYLLMRRDSNISTTAGLKPAGGDGGNISINTPFIIAVPSKDSNITAQAYTGTGGVITINGTNNSRTGLFGITRRSDDFKTSNDITTSSRFGSSGITVINALDTGLLENGLTELAQNFIDPNTLLANSCIVRNREKNRTSNGTFLVTGSGGLPVRPGDAPPASFPTGEVRSLPEAQTNQTWKPGDPIVEPQGIYRLASGKLVMSRECAP